MSKLSIFSYNNSNDERRFFVMENIQLIVEYDDISDEAFLESIGKIKYKLPMIGACVIEVSVESAVHLRSHARVKAVYETSNILAQSLTGKGVNIAILDTGLCPGADFTKPVNRLVAFKDFVNGKEDYYDDNGHGTHVTGCYALQFAF